MTAVQLAAQDETPTHARADREEGEVVDAAGDATPLLADGSEIDVVLEAHRNLQAPSQLGAERVALETRHAGRQADAAACRVDDPRHSDDRAVDAGALEPCRRHERVAEPHDRVEHATRVLAEDLHVLAGADLAGEVADRAAEEAGADVEAEHERRFGDGLEEHRAVARPFRVVLRLAHEAGLEQRLQRERHGRLRDPCAARDLRPRNGCATRGSPRARCAR